MTTTTTAPPKTHEPPVYPSLAALRLAHSKVLGGFDRNNPSPEILLEIEEFLRAGRLTGLMLSDEERRNAAQSILDYWSAVLYRAKRQPPDSALIPFGPPMRYLDVECPYPGLAPFDAQLRDFFLGRQAVVDEFVAKLKATRVMVVTGPRGCGKSSLVRAGLLPELQSGALPGSDHWSYVGPFVPGSHPLESLARALRLAQSRAGDQTSSTSAADLQADAAALTNAVRQLGPALLFVDQLEDVLPAPGESLDADRTAFVNCLVDLARASDVACVLVATRTDEAIEPSFHAADVLLDETARADVPDLGTRELRDAIQLPAELVGVTFDQEVVPDLVRALVGVPVAPPLLQFVLTSLWERRIGRVISWDSYRALMWDPRRRRSNAAYAIGRAAHERYDSLALDPPAQAAVKSILLQLIVPVEGADVLLRRLRVSQLRRGYGCTNVPRAEGFDRALRALIEARLVRCSTAGEDDDPNDSAVEVIHVALARNWPDLDQWLVEVRIEQERRRRLQAATKEWLDHQRSDDALWREALLDGLDEHDPALGAAEREFIVQSRRVARRRERRRARRRWLWRAAGAVFVVLAGVVALLALRGTQVARSHQLLAETHQTDDPAAALLMAVSAYQFNPDNDARVGVLDLLQRNRQLVGILGTYGQLTATAASSDGALLAGAETVASGGTHADVVLWNGVTLAEMTRLDTSVVDKVRRVRALAFDASHARLAVVFDNGSVSIWDTQNGQPMRWRPDATQPEQLVLGGRAQPLSALAFDSRDGHDWLVSIGQDGLVSWDLGTGQLVRQDRIAQRPGAALSPDGTLVAATGCSPGEVVPPCPAPKTLRVWDTASAQLVWTGQTRETATGVWFSAQSDLLALAGQNGVEVRDARAPDSVRAPKIATGPVVQMAVDSRSGLLVTAACEFIPGRGCSTEKDAHLQAFDINTWAAAGPPLPVDPDAVQGLALLPSSVPAGATAEPTLRVAVRRPSGIAVLDMQNDRVGLDPLALADNLGGLGPNVVRVGRDRVAVLGCVLAGKGSACPPGALHLADGRTGNSVGQNLVGEPPVGVTSLAATSDGSSLASGRVDGRIDVWDVPNGVNRASLSATDSGGRISALAFAPDGRLAASAARNLRLWLLDNPQAPRAVDLPSTNAQTSALAFSLDSTLLGSGGSDGTLEIWSVASGAAPRPRTYRGQTSPITSIVFSPDKRLVAASGSTKKVLIWDVDSTKLIGAPLVANNLEAVASLSFSGDGRTLTAGDGREIAAWRLDLSGTDFVRRACQIAHRNLSSDEWKTLQIDAPWTPACPEWRP